MRAEDHAVALGKLASGVQGAVGDKFGVRALGVVPAAVQLRVRPDAPAPRFVVDVGHGCVEGDVRRAGCQANGPRKLDPGVVRLAAGQANRDFPSRLKAPMFPEQIAAVGAAVQHGIGRPRPLPVVVPALGGGPELIAAVVEPLAVGPQPAGRRVLAGQLRVDPQEFGIGELELDDAAARGGDGQDLDQPIPQGGGFPAAVVGRDHLCREGRKGRQQKQGSQAGSARNRLHGDADGKEGRSPIQIIECKLQIVNCKLKIVSSICNFQFTICTVQSLHP